MKKLLFSLAILFSAVGGVLFSASLTYADAPEPYEAGDACSEAGFNDPLICGSRTSEGAELMNRVRNTLNVVYLWIGIIAVIVIVIGGIRYMTAAGSADKVRGAKNTIMYAMIGLIVTLMAFAITNVIIGAVDGKTPEESAQGGGGSGGGGSGGTDSPAEVKSIRMASKTTVLEGGTMQLKAIVVPDYAENRKLTFSSNNPSVAEVNTTGKITARAPGTAVVTAKASNGVKADVTVTVKEIVRVKNIVLTPTSLTLTKGKSGTILAKVEPSNAVEKTITWSSADTSIATVDNKGNVKAKKVGSTTITAKTKNGVTAEAKVTVKEEESSGGGGGGSGTPPETGSDGAIKVTDSLIQHLDSHYNQSGNSYSGYMISCSNSTIASTACGLSSYMAMHYAVTGSDIDYVTFTEEACRTGALTPNDGTAWDLLTRDYYVSKYGVTGKYIGNTFDAHAAEVKQGHPVVQLICGTGGFRSDTFNGCHYVVTLSYRSDNGGELYVWNPTNKNQGWVNRATFTDWSANRNSGVSWAMWRK